MLRAHKSLVGGEGLETERAGSTCRELSCDTPTAGLCANGGDITEGNGLLMQERAGMIVGEMSLVRQEEMGSSESFGEACGQQVRRQQG